MMKQRKNGSRVWSLTHWRAIKDESKVANRDWVGHLACSLLQYINVIANHFVMGNYFNELRWKIMSNDQYTLVTQCKLVTF